ncbi:MAG: DUF1553 domain-containing protein, partial [Bryobacteraceae bacterium]
GIFRSTEMYAGLRHRPQFNGMFFSAERLLRLDGVAPYQRPDGDEIEALRGELTKKLADAERRRDRPDVRRISLELGRLPIPRNLVMGVGEARRMEDCEVNLRGDPHALGDKVGRGFVQVIDANPPEIPKDASGRLQLAEWLTRRDNPLTARVMANRAWHHLLGRGIVDTVDNFGKSGSKPTHPELLDYLSLRLMDQGWSVKKLIREIMLSRTYQLSAEHHARNWEREPDNRLLWRQQRRRLEVEAIRDSMLLISGQLTLTPPEASPVYQWPTVGEVNRGPGARVEPWETKHTYRSVYVPVIRNAVSRFWETFDFPEPSETKGSRDITTVAPQALFLLNSPFVETQARTAAERVLAATASGEQRVQRAYRQVFSREASKLEIDRALIYIQETIATHREPEASDGIKAHEAWTRFYQALFASAEFRYRS